MLKKALQKLNSNSGLSMLLALLMMLVSIMVIAVVISAADTSVKNINYDEDQQQMYLTVSSAAMLIRSELEKGSVKLWNNGGNPYYIIGEDYDSEYYSTYMNSATFDEYYKDEWFSDSDNLLGHTNDGSGYTCAFGPLIETSLNDLLNKKKASYSFVMSLGDNNYNDALKDVHVEFTMDENYDIRVILTNQDNSGNVIYFMTLSIPVDKYTTPLNFYNKNLEDSNGNPKPKTTKSATVLSWTGGSIMRGSIS